MYALFIENAPEDPEYNDAAIAELAVSVGFEIIRADYKKVSDNSKLRQEAELIIISGVPFAYDAATAQQRVPYYGWLLSAKRTDQPVIGICLGHQIISLVHGGDLISQATPEQGIVNLTIKQRDKVFTDITSPVEIASDHWCWVTVPETFDLLATNTRITIDNQASNHIMRHKSLPMYGFQAHIERTSLGRDLIKNIALA